MKKVIMMAAALAVLTGCERELWNEESMADEMEAVEKGATKKFTFTVKGDFGSPVFSYGDGVTNAGGTVRQNRTAQGQTDGVTRGYLAADGKDMTDLWVFDFMGGVCVQSVHQSDNTAEDFGQPVMELAYGNHHVYFVASRGGDAVVDTDKKTITWGTVRDTFWKDYEVSVVSTSNGNRAVTLDRVVTKLRMAVDDVVPATCASVTVTPAEWYNGINYTTGGFVAMAETAQTVTVPAAYQGTTGQLAVSIFGMSKGTEWTTNVTLTAKKSDDTVLGTVTVENVPLKVNRATEYHGNLFGSGGAMSCSLNATWETKVEGSW